VNGLIENLGRVFFCGFNKFDDETKYLIERYRPGGILIYPGILSDEVSLVEFFDFLSQKGDFLISSDHEGGQLETIPYIPSSIGNMAFGFSDPSFTRRYTEMSGGIMRIIGFNMVFAPVLDLYFEGNSPAIGLRTFGKDPERVAEYGVAACQGFTSSGILPCIKHFPGHGRSKKDSHYGKTLVEVPYEEMWNVDLLPFRITIEHGAEAIMTAHVTNPRIDDLPATLSRKFLTDILRNKMNFSGLILSDAVEMKALSGNFSVEEIVARFFNAGGNMLLLGRENNLPVYYETLEKLLKDGKIPSEAVEASVRKVEYLIEKYKNPSNIGFMAKAARNALKISVNEKPGKEVHLVLPKARDLSPADNTSRYYRKIEEVFRKFFDVKEMTYYDLEEGPAIENSSYQVLDVVVDAFRCEKSLEAHRKLRNRAKKVLYMIVRDPYDETFFEDSNHVLTHSLNPISLYEALKKLS